MPQSKSIVLWAAPVCWKAEEALTWEIAQRGLQVERQVSVPIRYKDQMLSAPLRLDLLINQLVIIECKATSEYNSIFEAQTLTYLRLTGLKLGLVINFGEKMVKRGIHRVVNGLPDDKTGKPRSNF